MSFMSLLRESPLPRLARCLEVLRRVGVVPQSGHLARVVEGPEMHLLVAVVAGPVWMKLASLGIQSVLLRIQSTLVRAQAALVRIDDAPG